MKKAQGILTLLVFVFLATALMSDAFLLPYNLENLMKRSSLFGIIAIGVAFVIITGGIDLSIGSVICLVGCGLPFLLEVRYEIVDQVSVTRIDPSAGSVELPARPPSLEPGDRVRLFGGEPDNTGVYRVLQLRGSLVTLDPAPPRAATRGELTRLLAPEPDGRGWRIPGHVLEPRDRVTVIRANGQEGPTSRVTSTAGDLIELSEPLPGTVIGVMTLQRQTWTSPPVALAIVLGLSLLIGLFHGLLIARLKLQPFIVTLCGLLLYRGITRGFTQDQTQGLGDEYPALKLIATAELARVTMSGVLATLGLLLVVFGLARGWLSWRKHSARGAAARAAAVPLVLGLALAIVAARSEWARPEIPVTAEANREVIVDLPEGTRRVRLDAGKNTGDWVTLAETSVAAGGERQQLTVPSLETIRGTRPGAWTRVRVVVVERDSPTIGLPAPLVILLVVAALAAVFLNQTIYGRYLLAMGNNEEAARHSGINTERMTIVAYVICSGLAGLGGVLFVLDINSAQPVDFGNFYELYAIAAAVLGGCSLRGGEGTILGVVIGAALMRVLKNMITLVDWIPTHIEYAIIGAVILAGVTIDELVKRIAAKRRAERVRSESE